MKQFTIPSFYRSPFISSIKKTRLEEDPRRENYSPAEIDLGPLRFYVARHFGFCYGVENAIEIAFRALDENPGKRVYLISQMIHNPVVNADLISRGVGFLMDTEGKQLVPFDELRDGDVVIVPAFGATLSVLEELKKRRLNLKSYDTTCPFVERVWNRSAKLGDADHTIIIHGKYRHEETRATFSRTVKHGPSLVVLDIAEARRVCDFMEGKLDEKVFMELFRGKCSEDFDPRRHLVRLGVVNQTTMLATETAEIADLFRETLAKLYGSGNLKEHFADTRDTLCYATNQNQDSVYAMLEKQADLALVIGGYNSSNTSHLAEICEKRLPAYFIKDAGEILSRERIRHFDLHSGKVRETGDWLPQKRKTDILVTSGASCPDSIVEEVMRKVVTLFPGSEFPA